MVEEQDFATHQDYEDAHFSNSMIAKQCEKFQDKTNFLDNKNGCKTCQFIDKDGQEPCKSCGDKYPYDNYKKITPANRFDAVVIKGDVQPMPNGGRDEIAELKNALKILLDAVFEYVNYKPYGEDEDARTMNEMELDDLRNNGKLEEFKKLLER